MLGNSDPRDVSSVPHMRRNSCYWARTSLTCRGTGRCRSGGRTVGPLPGLRLPSEEAKQNTMIQKEICINFASDITVKRKVTP
jgi:hypothetical protein